MDKQYLNKFSFFSCIKAIAKDSAPKLLYAYIPFILETARLLAALIRRDL
jgi:hypothetical protein